MVESRVSRGEAGGSRYASLLILAGSVVLGVGSIPFGGRPTKARGDDIIRVNAGQPARGAVDRDDGGDESR